MKNKSSSKWTGEESLSTFPEQTWEGLMWLNRVQGRTRAGLVRPVAGNRSL